MVGSQETIHSVRAWPFRSTLLEWHVYPPGPAGALPLHQHDEYQICLSIDAHGEYLYRGQRIPVPAGSFSVIHPGEVHAARDPDDRMSHSRYGVMYVSPEALRNAAEQIEGRSTSLPLIPDCVFFDEQLADLFLQFLAASREPASLLNLDACQLTLLTRLVRRHGNGSMSIPRLRGERRAVQLVRHYLDDMYAEDVSLNELSQLAGLSPFHLARVFKYEVGLPPHAYQVGVRIARAKALILAGVTITQAAHATGFADQSHFARHFKRLVGTAPGRYVHETAAWSKNRKNVQEGSHPIV